VEKFNDCIGLVGSQPDSDNSKDECLVDLVLGNGFVELETLVAFPGCEPNAKLIQTIAKRSPLLKKLELDFYLMKEGTNSEILRPVILSLASLEHLTNLLLMFPDELDVKL